MGRAERGGRRHRRPNPDRARAAQEEEEVVSIPQSPGRPPAAPHGHVLRRPTEEGVQQEAGLHQREGTWVPANVRERGQLRSHPQEEEEVVQERRLCCGGRLRVRLRLRGLRLLPEEDEVLHLPASVALGGAGCSRRRRSRVFSPKPRKTPGGSPRSRTAKAYRRRCATRSRAAST